MIPLLSLILHCVTVSISVFERTGVARAYEPVVIGIPFPRSTVWSSDVLTVEGCPTQAEPLAYWHDGSIKWALVTFLASVVAGDTAEFMLTDAGGGTPWPDLAADSGDFFEINTGRLLVHIRKDSFNLFDLIVLDGDTLVRPADGGIVITADNVAYLSRYGQIDYAQIESNGPIRCVIKLMGDHRSESGAQFCRFTVRVEAYRDQPWLRVFYTLQNPMPGDLNLGGGLNAAIFSDLSVVLQPCLGSMLSYEIGDAKGHVQTGYLTQPVTLYQDSDGTPEWDYWKLKDYGNHNDPNLKPQHYVTFRGWRIYEGDVPVDSGYQADGFAMLTDGEHSITCWVRYFWQNFPKAIRVDPTGRIEVALFPSEFAHEFELRGGEEKTHELLFYFANELSDPKPVVLALNTPLVGLASPEWYAQTYALFELVPASNPLATDTNFVKYEQMVETALHGPGYHAEGLLAARDSAHLFGWMDFGELPVDFEAYGDACYNLQYDHIYAAILQMLRRHEIEWYDLIEPALFHSTDIDIYHTTGDMNWRNGGRFPEPDHGATDYQRPHRYHWPQTYDYSIDGYVYGYFITGNRRFYDVAVEHANNAEYRVDNTMGRGTNDGYAYAWIWGDSARVMEPRPPAMLLEVLTQAYIITGDVGYLESAELVVDDSHAARQRYINGPTGEHELYVMPWMVGLLMNSLGRYCKLRDEMCAPDTHAISSLIKYADFLVNHAWIDSGYPHGNTSLPKMPGFPYRWRLDGSSNDIFLYNWMTVIADGLTYAYHYSGNPVHWMRARDSFLLGVNYPAGMDPYGHPNILYYWSTKIAVISMRSGMPVMYALVNEATGDSRHSHAVARNLILSNPQMGELRLEFTAPLPSCRVKIYDMIGRLVKQVTVPAGTKSIEVGTLPATGVYFITWCNHCKKLVYLR